MREIELGLGDPPVRRYLYVGQDEQGSGSCWYEFKHDHNAKIPVEKRALTGYLTGLRLHDVKTKRHGTKAKLDILMDAGQPYAIRAGVETVFVRGVVLALEALTRQDNTYLAEPLTIVVSPSTDNNKIVFGAVYRALNGERVRFEWDKDVDISSYLLMLQALVGSGETDDEHRDGDEETDSDLPAQPYTGQFAQRAPSRPAGLLNENVMKELRRVAGVKGVDLGEELALRFPNAVALEDLTTAEGIELRKQLMEL